MHDKQATFLRTHHCPLLLRSREMVGEGLGTLLKLIRSGVPIVIQQTCGTCMPRARALPSRPDVF